MSRQPKCSLWLALLVAPLAGCGGGGGGGDAPAPVRVGPCGSALGYHVKAASALKGGGPVLKLDWVSPFERSDGSGLPLDELGGFKIYVGDAAGHYTDLIQVTAGTTTFELPAFTGQGYRLTLSAYDRFGNESVCSSEIAVQMP